MKKFLLLGLLSVVVFSSVNAMRGPIADVNTTLNWGMGSLKIPDTAKIYNRLNNAIELTFAKQDHAGFISSGYKEVPMLTEVIRIPAQSEYTYPVKDRRPEKVKIAVLGELSLRQKFANYLAQDVKEFRNSCFQELVVVPTKRGFEIQIHNCQECDKNSCSVGD